jgi:predicted hotdog family 3-hydroxylacyl-ACP dehydratase
MERFPAIEKLVPHGLPMRALDELEHWEPGHAVCRVRIREGMPFVGEHGVDSVVLLEYMAQAVAACLGHEAYVGGDGIRAGMIVGVRKMKLHRPSIPLQSEVRIAVDRLSGTEEVSVFTARAEIDDILVADARLTLFHADPDTVSTMPGS